MGLGNGGSNSPPLIHTRMNIADIIASKKPAIQAVIEKWVPRKFELGSIATICGQAEYEHDPESLTAGLSVPVYDMLDRGMGFTFILEGKRLNTGGKGWRGALLLLIVEALGGDIGDALDLSCISEVVHNGTLAIDGV